MEARAVCGSVGSAMVICFMVLVAEAVAAQSPGGTGPRGEIRIIQTSDSLSEFMMLPENPEREDFHEYVDLLADNGVDVYAMDVFISGFCMWTTRFTDMYDRYETFAGLGDWYCARIGSVFARGWEPIDIWAERCHRKGMKFLASWRMSDRHHRGKWDDPHFSELMSSWHKKNRQFWVGGSWPLVGGLDFSFQEVRDYMFTSMEEVVQGFDVDGIELNWIRYPHVFPFPPKDAGRDKDILTEFTRRIREMLDREGEKKGRRLLLSVRVPQTLAECENLALDIPAYVREGLIDMLCPNDWGSTDFNAPYDEFAALTRKGDCCLYPAISPYPSRSVHTRILMSLPAYRGVVRNLYAQGADGFSTFNFTYHWSGRMGIAYPGVPENYPKAFAFLKALDDPDGLWDKDRHYVFYAFGRQSFPGLEDRSGAKITLARGETPDFKRCVMRAAEDWGGSEKGIVRFVAVGLVPGDRITVKFNGEVVRKADIVRTYRADGRTNEDEGATLPAHTVCEFVPATPPQTPGKQVLELALAQSAPDAGDKAVAVSEIEVAVSASGEDAREVLSQTRRRPSPPIESLAGYHPPGFDGFRESRGNGTTGHVGAVWSGHATKGAQSFVLEAKAAVKRVQLLVCGTPEAEEPMRMSIRADADGIPAEAPVTPEAVASFNPWQQTEGITLRRQGYFTFDLNEPAVLDPGTWWLVFEMDPSGQPSAGHYYAPLLGIQARERYPKGRYMTGAKEWKEIKHKDQPVCAFFSVFGDDVE